MKPSLKQFYNQFRPLNDRVALVDAMSTSESQTQFSYSELSVHIGKIASLLAREGLASGDRLAVMLPNGIDFVMLYLGCLHAGITIVPINPDLPGSDISYILQLTKPGCLIIDERYLDSMPSSHVRLWKLDSGERLYQQSNSLPLAQSQVQADNILGIFFTSGTTNRPKGICHYTRRMLANAEAFNQHMGWNRQLRMLHTLPMSYMAGFLNCLLCPFMAGGTVILADQFNAGTALRFWTPAIRHDVNAVWLTPTMLSLLSKLNRDPAIPQWTADHLHSVCVATAPLPESVKHRFEQDFGITTYESYGMSEILLVAGNSPSHPQASHSVGRILPGLEVDLRENDETPGNERQADIWIKTPYALAGYLNPNNGELDSPLEDGWMETGDLGYLDESARMYITGRKKDLIIHGGYNVSPRAIEETLLHHQAIDEAAVIGIPHAFHGEEVIALLVIKDDYRLNAIDDELRMLCKNSLLPAACPSQFIQRPSFPHSVTGKIQKHLLRQDYMDSQSTHQS